MAKTRTGWSTVLMVLCVLTTISTARAQTVDVEVRVIDAITEETLPGATVQIEGTDLGRITDAQGQVRIEGVELPAGIMVRHIGYQTLHTTITARPPGDVVRITFELEPMTLWSDDVEVVAQRTGELIMRQVIARKEVLGNRTERYTMEAYTQFRLQRQGSYEIEPTLIRFSEVLSNVHWQHRGDMREVVVARRRIPDGNPFRYADIEPIPDFYFSDTVELEGRLIPTPTHPDALTFYTFHSGGVTVENEHRYIDIAVIPRRRGLFAGRIRVVDSLFVLAEAELRIPDHGMISGFVQDWHAEYRVVFSPARDSLWLPERFERYGLVQVGTTGSSIPRVSFHQITFVDRWMPGVAGPSEFWAMRNRYYNPMGVYGGREVFGRYQGYQPISDEEQELLADLRNRDLQRMLFRTGLLSAYVRIPIYGSDDSSR